MKRILKPIKNSVICKRISEKNSLNNNNGVLYRADNVDLYEILDFSHDEDIDFKFKCGDVVMSNSTGDEIEINNSEIVYLFKIENIMCKVEDYL
jgi:co-chaperonin GroES (HSP10)